jgi:putative transcriptional regulator
VDGLGESPAAAIPVFLGGPVQQEFLFILRTPLSGQPARSGQEQPVEGVVFEPATRPAIEWLTGEWSDLPLEDRAEVRFYAGYSGWGPGQLEEELKRDSWVVIKATRDIVFHPEAEAAWAEAFVKKGPLYQIILQTGFKPSMS